MTLKDKIICSQNNTVPHKVIARQDHKLALRITKKCILKQGPKSLIMELENGCLKHRSKNEQYSRSNKSSLSQNFILTYLSRNREGQLSPETQSQQQRNDIN